MTSNRWNPSLRSSSRKPHATFSGGSAKINANDTARNAKQNSGIRFSDIPGARILKIVTMKLIDAAVLEMPLKISP